MPACVGGGVEVGRGVYICNSNSSFQMADFLKHPSLTMDIRCALADSKGSSKRDVRAMTLNRHGVFSREQIQLINWSIGAVQKSLKKKFPNISQAISSWKRNDTSTQSTWTAIRPYIS